MEYKQEIAEEMLADRRWKGAITEKMVKVWKTRGTIPNQYFNQKFVEFTKKGDDKAFQVKDPYYNESFILKTPLNEAEKVEQEKILKILQSNKFSAMAIFRKLGIPYSYYNDAVREGSKRSDLRAEYILMLKKYINEIRNAANKILTVLDNKKQFTHTNVELLDNFFMQKYKDEINYITIINHDAYSKRVYYRFVHNAKIFDNDEVVHIIHHLKIFLFESQL